MADDDQPGPPRRPSSAYQAIEPLDEGAEPVGHQAAPASRAVAPSPPQAPPERPEPPAVPPVPVAVRFASAAAALAFAGQLLSVGRGDGLTFWAEADHARWVRAHAELDLTRELAAAAHGTTFVEVAPGQLAEDRGWGSPPAADSLVTSVVAGSSLAPLSLAELVRIAGLYQVAERPATAIHVMLPGALLAGVVRRALDLRLDVAHRPVRLRPLFAGPDSADAGTALLEVRLSAGDSGLPASLLTALARDDRLTVCRPGGQDGNLLVQYGMATPLHDDLLAALLAGQAWVLTCGRLGCQLLDPAAEFVNSVSIVRLADGYRLESATPPPDDRPAPSPVRVVRMRTYGRGVDAVLLTDADLSALALVLEGHPLSERAQLIRGRDKHLLVVSGGLLEQLPVGEALYCIGPGPLYLPLGYGTRPQLPASARRALFTVDDNAAVVLLPEVMLRFGVTGREPVWRLWAGPPPQLDLQLPPDAVEALAAAAAPSAGPGQGTQPEGDPLPGNIRTWLDEALEAEFRGELAAAAELHERHGDPVRAARLWARAADAAS